MENFMNIMWFKWANIDSSYDFVHGHCVFTIARIMFNRFWKHTRSDGARTVWR